MFSSIAFAQSPDPAKWMCRNLADSGGFVYQGESVFGTQACRPIQQAAPVAPTAANVAATPQQDAAAPSAPAATPTVAPSPAVAATAGVGLLVLSQLEEYSGSSEAFINHEYIQAFLDKLNAEIQYIDV